MPSDNRSLLTKLLNTLTRPLSFIFGESQWQKVGFFAKTRDKTEAAKRAIEEPSPEPKPKDGQAKPASQTMPKK